MHLVFILSFNILCSISKVHGVDPHKHKIGLISKILKNQASIDLSLRELYTQFKGGEVYDPMYCRAEQKEYRVKR